MSNLNPRNQKDKRKIKKIGIILTVLIHGLVIGALAYTYAWIPPDPPIPKKGMSVDLGNFYEARQGKKTKKNEVKKDNIPKIEQKKVQEQEEIKAVEETQPVEEILLAQKEDAIPLKEKKAEEIKVEAKKKAPIKKEETKQIKLEKKVAVKEKRTESLENDGKDLGDGKLKKSKYADAGKKNGKPDGQVKKGLQGENGLSLDLAGWMWLRKPVVNDPTDDSGTITIELTIDKYGNVVSSQIINKTVSLTTANHYIDAIERSKFRPIKRGSRFSQNTKGTVTFTARVK